MVGGDRAERLGGEPRAGLGADHAELAELGDDAVVVRRVGRGRDAGRVPGGRPEQRRAADVDHLDGLVDPDELDPDRRGERLDVDDDEVDQADALGLELGQLLRRRRGGPGSRRRPRDGRS